MADVNIILMKIDDKKVTDVVNDIEICISNNPLEINRFIIHFTFSSVTNEINSSNP